MKYWGTWMGVVISILLIGTVGLTAAQGPHWPGSGGWGMGGAYNRMYDPAKVETVSGEVEKVEQFSTMRGMSPGIHLLIKTGKDTLSVHLGPAHFISRLDTKIKPGDKVEVKGARITFMGRPALIAVEVKKGDDVLILRDANGTPVWAGWRRR
jgi:hypothetical protein